MATAKKKTIRTIPQERTPMPEQDPKVRAKNFQEVACGYRLEDALREAERCLMCPDQPCVRGCPVSIDIPNFIAKITQKHYNGAYDIISLIEVIEHLRSDSKYTALTSRGRSFLVRLPIASFEQRLAAPDAGRGDGGRARLRIEGSVAPRIRRLDPDLGEQVEFGLFQKLGDKSTRRLPEGYVPPAGTTLG